MRIHVVNLHASLIEIDLKRLFSKFGEVDDVTLVRDKLNNRSSGRAYVEMPIHSQGAHAILVLHNTEVGGKKLGVTQVVYDPAPNSSWNISNDI